MRLISFKVFRQTVSSAITKVARLPVDAVNQIAQSIRDVVVESGLASFYMNAKYRLITALTAKDTISISDVAISHISSTVVKISWYSNKPTTSKINYGINLSYGQDVQDNKYVKDHVLILENLDPGTTYYFEIMGQVGNQYIYDAYYSFTTKKK